MPAALAVLALAGGSFIFPAAVVVLAFGSIRGSEHHDDRLAGAPGSHSPRQASGVA